MRYDNEARYSRRLGRTAASSEVGEETTVTFVGGGGRWEDRSWMSQKVRRHIEAYRMKYPGNYQCILGARSTSGLCTSASRAAATYKYGRTFWMASGPASLANHRLFARRRFSLSLQPLAIAAHISIATGQKPWEHRYARICKPSYLDPIVATPHSGCLLFRNTDRP